MAKRCPIFVINQLQPYLVTVIVAFMNEELFLSQAIESVMQQDYQHWELIMVDDGSTDGSTAIAKAITGKNPDKFIYTEHPGHINKGVSASRNLALSMAKGALIAILDADDVWLPSKLRLQVEIMNNNPVVAMTCEASEYWYSWNNIHSIKKDKKITIGADQDQIFYPPRLAEILYPLSSGAAPCPSGIMMKKSALEKKGGFEGEFINENQMYEDQAFLAKFYLTEPVYISSFCNNKYRQREGSLVQKVITGGRYQSVRKYFLDWLRNYLDTNNIKYKTIDRLLEHAFEPYNRPVLHYARNLFHRFGARLKKSKSA